MNYWKLFGLALFLMGVTLPAYTQNLVPVDTTGLSKDFIRNLYFKEEAIQMSKKSHFAVAPYNLNFEQDSFFTNIIEADIDPHFYLFSTFRNRFLIDFNPRVNIRIRSGFSAPVKSPSFLPGLTFYYLTKADLEKKRFQYFSISYRHHSNGQDSCALRGAVYDNDLEKCVLPAPEPFPRFNRIDGNFSTNLFTFGYHWIKTRQLSTDEEIQPWFNRVFNRWLPHWFGKEQIFSIKKMYRAELEVHPFGLFNIQTESDGIENVLGFEPALYKRYGFLRTNLEYNVYRIGRHAEDVRGDREDSWELETEYDRLVVQLSVLMNGIDEQRYPEFEFWKRFNVDVAYYNRIWNSYNVSFFVKLGFMGQDNYNIFFEDSFAYIQAGLATGAFFYRYRNRRR